jgi:hypothetical protein
VVESDLPLAFEATKIQSPCVRAIFDHLFFAIDEQLVEGIPRHGSTAASGSTAGV